MDPMAAMLTFRPVPRHAATPAAGSKAAARGPDADPFEPLPLAFYRRPAEEVGRGLLGRYLVRRLGGERLVLRLVEVEAYLGAPDRASHAWGGRRTARNESLYLAGGHAYVYFIYGMHWCLNAVTGEAGTGGAVLLRAGEPVVGEEHMRALRRLGERVRPGDVAGGPGKLCQAVAVDRSFDGRRLDAGELILTLGEPVPAARTVAGPRIGVDYAGEAAAWPLRFAEAGNLHVSRPRPPQAP
jgi:DNA-3-methyladenine glycosylase